jgi:hypothetical protein
MTPVSALLGARHGSSAVQGLQQNVGSMSENYLHFDGDPQTDSARRHLERVLAQPQSSGRRWPWIIGLLAGGGSWTIWRAWKKTRDNRTRQQQQS